MVRDSSALLLEDYKTLVQVNRYLKLRCVQLERRAHSYQENLLELGRLKFDMRLLQEQHNACEQSYESCQSSLACLREINHLVTTDYLRLKGRVSSCSKCSSKSCCS